jgi:hypothetical protein
MNIKIRKKYEDEKSSNFKFYLIGMIVTLVYKYIILAFIRIHIF